MDISSTHPGTRQELVTELDMPFSEVGLCPSDLLWGLNGGAEFRDGISAQSALQECPEMDRSCSLKSFGT